ncbi:MAG: adenylosuccinate synthetase [Acetobacteraceae bacterium]
MRQAITVGGIHGLVLTKLDVLDGLPELRICTGYEIGGKLFRHLPAAPGAQAGGAAGLRSHGGGGAARPMVRAASRSFRRRR